MGRAQQEQLAQQVAQRSTMPSMTNQVSCLRAQLAHRDAQLEQVRAERESHKTTFDMTFLLCVPGGVSFCPFCPLMSCLSYPLLCRR